MKPFSYKFALAIQWRWNTFLQPSAEANSTSLAQRVIYQNSTGGHFPHVYTSWSKQFCCIVGKGIKSYDILNESK